MKRDFNLFGEPLPRNLGKVGRNEHVPTAENVSRVRQLVMAGWRAEKIAEEIGISRPTLRKHYLPDFQKSRIVALGEVKAKTLLLLEKAAQDGNVAAMKELLRIVREEELNLGIGANPPQPEREPKPEKLGKKEQANHAAQTGDENTEWRSLLN
jgi:hypothetical protein